MSSDEHQLSLNNPRNFAPEKSLKMPIRSAIYSPLPGQEIDSLPSAPENSPSKLISKKNDEIVDLDTNFKARSQVWASENSESVLDPNTPGASSSTGLMFGLKNGLGTPSGSSSYTSEIFRSFGCFNLLEKRLFMEAVPSLLFSLFGLILAGVLLDKIQHWDLFIEVSELIILVPVLLNLKGNLEMNMATRVSTAANLGELDHPSSRWEIIFGNLQIMQVQSVIVGFIAGVFSLALGSFVHMRMNSFADFSLVLSCSVLTACVTSLLLGSLMCFIVVISLKIQVNPDNITTPIAASLGDLVTLGVLGVLAVGIRQIPNYFVFNVCILLATFISVPVWLRFINANRSVRDVIKHGWTPLLVSMVLSSIAGLTLERYIEKYKPMALLSPILNGISGNVAAIYTSRITTSLHINLNSREDSFGLSKTQDLSLWASLLTMYLPVQLVIIAVIGLFNLGHITLTAGFVILYLIMSVLVVVALMVFTKVFCHWLWKREMNPHHYALPYMAAFGDIIGSLGLVFALFILKELNDPSLS